MPTIYADAVCLSSPCPPLTYSHAASFLSATSPQLTPPLDQFPAALIPLNSLVLVNSPSPSSTVSRTSMNDSADEPPLLHRIRSWLPAKLRATDCVPGRAPHDHNSSSTLNSESLPSHSQHVSKLSTTPLPADEKSSEEGQGHQQMPASTLVDDRSLPLPPPAPPPVAEKREREESSSMTSKDDKQSLWKRFLIDCKRIIFCSWINWLLIFVPVAIVLGAIERAQGERSGIVPTVVFSMNAIAIIPLASLLAYATENVATRMGDTVGALLNVTFGNAVELIVFIIALVANQIKIVQAAALGSILSNLLLILGMCFLFGGLRFREQLYNSAVSQMSACLLSLSVVSLVLPTAFHASFSNTQTADRVVLKVSRGTSVVLLFVYVLYLLFQLKSHAYMYASTPQHLIDEESHPGVLAEMLNSSSSSDSSTSSSSSDSDSSSGSHTTAKRIRRALRRKRRKSSVNSDDTYSMPSTVQASSAPGHLFTNDAPGMRSTHQFSPKPSHSLEAMISGDEADVDRKPRKFRRRGTGITSRDFEVERTGSPDDAVHSGRKSKNNRKKSKKPKAKKARTESQPCSHIDGPGDREDRIEAQPAVTASVGPPQVNVTTDEGAPPSPVSRRSFHFRDLSLTTLPRAISPGIFSQQQQQQQQAPSGNTTSTQPAMLAVPQADANIRRTTSMPEMGNKAQSLNLAPISAQPLPHLMPSNQPIGAIDPKDLSVQKPLSRTSAVILLLVATGLVAVCAEFLVHSIDYLIKETGVSQAFIGLIILPMVGNAAEHVTAVTVASKNKMDLAIGVALGSSIQIAIFVTPLVVLLGWCLGRNMSLHFSLFETISLFASAFLVNYLMIDGRSNYLEGALLIAVYVIIALAAFFYPSCENLSEAGGLTEGTCL